MLKRLHETLEKKETLFIHEKKRFTLIIFFVKNQGASIQLDRL